MAPPPPSILASDLAYLAYLLLLASAVYGAAYGVQLLAPHAHALWRRALRWCRRALYDSGWDGRRARDAERRGRTGDYRWDPNPREAAGHDGGGAPGGDGGASGGDGGASGGEV